jgi:hypothetical protein
MIPAFVGLTFCFFLGIAWFGESLRLLSFFGLRVNQGQVVEVSFVCYLDLVELVVLDTDRFVDLSQVD